MTEIGIAALAGSVVVVCMWRYKVYRQRVRTTRAIRDEQDRVERLLAQIHSMLIPITDSVTAQLSASIKPVRPGEKALIMRLAYMELIEAHINYIPAEYVQSLANIVFPTEPKCWAPYAIKNGLIYPLFDDIPVNLLIDYKEYVEKYNV